MSAKYPGSVVTIDELGDGADNRETILDGGISDADTILNIVNGDLLKSSGVLKIEDESIFFASRTNNTVSGCIRGVADTTPSAHTGGRPVKYTDSFYYVTRLQEELIATQNLIGANAAKIYPIGSVYINAVNNTNPATLLGFGTWEAFGAGRVPVGYNASDSDFNAAGKTGGAKTHGHTVNSHSHTINDHSHNANHKHDLIIDAGGPRGGVSYLMDISTNNFNTGGASDRGTNASAPGTDAPALSSVQPYITVFMWKRTA